LIAVYENYKFGGYKTLSPQLNTEISVVKAVDKDPYSKDDKKIILTVSNNNTNVETVIPLRVWEALNEFISNGDWTVK
jgi:hypothetical protein